MKRTILFAIVCAAFVIEATAQQPKSVTARRPDPATAEFDAVLGRALAALSKAGSYVVDVDSKSGAGGADNGAHGGSHYRLTQQGGKYRVEVQSHAAQSPDLICVNDGANVTTLFPARNLYSQHPVDSREATLDGNTMLAMSLQGSALDILLQRDVAHFIHAQATGIKDNGETTLNGRKARQFELVWGGANIALWFAAEGEPLLLQFTRMVKVPTGANQHYATVSTASFQWRLGAKPAADAFTINLPTGARRVNEIYDALAGDEAASKVNKPLPKLQLAKLDGSDVELAAAADKKATVLIFWATWCAASVEDLPAMHKFVSDYKGRGVEFYAVNVGEQPGAVRRFTAKHPLVSTVLLDPRGKASGELRIAELPAVAVVAPDNTVRAILHGTSKEMQDALSSQLNELLSASPSSSTARRPSDAPARSK
jgi:thiol-disulfide isomerase/thioredoxin